MTQTRASRAAAVAASLLMTIPLLSSCALETPVVAGRASQTQSTAPSSAGAQTAQSGPTVASEVYKANGPSVVNITSIAVTIGQNGPQSTPQGIGSGFIYDLDGHIVTNNHVVEEADQLLVTFSSGASVPATLTGRDPDNDLAVVQVDVSARASATTVVRDLIKPVTLGDSNDVTVGEAAVAIGSPMGLQQTVTQGVISALRAPEDPTNTQELGFLGGSIQTDAAINPGNSGGPLFNASGKVIAVNTAGLSPTGGSIGLNFGIPVNTVKRVVPGLISNGCYIHAYVGVTGIPLAAMGRATKVEAGLPLGQQGILVQSATIGAAKAGINAGDQATSDGQIQLTTGGDVITAVDGHPISTGGELRTYVENNKKPGDTVTLTVLRGPTYQTSQDIVVTLTGRPSGGVTCKTQ